MKTKTNTLINYELLLKHYNLKNLVRYNHRVRLKDESVAEHSYYVTLFTRMICNELGNEATEEVALDALTYALIHDLPEIYMSDIPHPVKELNPDLDTELDIVEDEIIKVHYPEYYDLYAEVTENKWYDAQLVGLIVKLADILSVIQYASLEVRLGNKGALDIVDDSITRYIHCRDEIEDLTGVSIKSFEEVVSDEN